MRCAPALLITVLFSVNLQASTQTTALWLFNEPAGLYPSSVLDDSSDNDLPMVIGLGGQVVKGRFGNGLSLADRAPTDIIPGDAEFPERFGMIELQPEAGRITPPLTWFSAQFSALMTSGENHLRNEVRLRNATDTDLNLGGFDWTVEFWYAAGDDASGLATDGVVFEIGAGPRGENNQVTQLKLAENANSFVLTNQPSQISLQIPTDHSAVASSSWHHYAFIYNAKTGQLSHHVDGKIQTHPDTAMLQALPFGEEAYFTVGRDGLWGSPLIGVLDELRFSKGQVYTADFDLPESFSTPPVPVELVKGLPLLFTGSDQHAPLQLGARKHLFADAAILVDSGEADFVVNPPRLAERVIDNIEGVFRKHLSIVEGDDGVIRIYNAVEEDYLAVYTSVDGVNFERPDLGHGTIEGYKNIVIAEKVGGLGNPFFDVNGPDDERWKYFTDYQRRGIYLYTSPDGYKWKRHKTVVLPFRSGTQSSTFYDEQRQVYVSYHRSGIFHTPANATQRSSVVTEHKDLRVPHPFTALSRQDYVDLSKQYPMRNPMPWWLDNGPLTPGGFGMEYPHNFDPSPTDPVGTDFYLTKAMKYPWAPDTYLAFPIAYFHYEKDGPITRTMLMDEERGRGSGPLESQISISRNGLDWKRYPRPAYIPIGRHEGRNIVTAYIGNGMVRRGDEIWQYYFGETQYHSAYTEDDAGRGVYRVVQRLDGFISLDSPYDHEITVVTKPLVFEGDRLQLNIDTDAMGYAQVGFLDENGKAIEGFSVDDSIYINGDFIREEVEWLNGFDVSALAGKTVQVVFRMRGSKLYAMQFVDSGGSEN